MPPTLFGFVFRVSARNQVWISLLAIAVFTLNTAPLELQRRMMNAIVHDREMKLVLGLAAAYFTIVLSEGVVKLLMNVYRGWVCEKTVRVMRLTASAVAGARPGRRNEPDIQGVEISLILAEPEPIGAFAGIAVSEPILQAGILASVFGYMLYIQPLLAAVSIAIFSPQFVFVPLMQRAINRRVQSRILVLRETSVDVLPKGIDEAETALRQEMRFAEIFELNLGIFKLKYSMNFLMNLTAEWRQDRRARRRWMVGDRGTDRSGNAGRFPLRPPQPERSLGRPRELVPGHDGQQRQVCDLRRCGEEIRQSRRKHPLI